MIVLADADNHTFKLSHGITAANGIIDLQASGWIGNLRWIFVVGAVIEN